LSNLSYIKSIAGIVIGTCITAALLPALPHSGDLVPLVAAHLEAAAFIDVSLRAVRQDAATDGDQQAPPLFGMETESVAGEACRGSKMMAATCMA
jgi:hypothetical protein